jgi:hypothetical protein
MDTRTVASYGPFDVERIDTDRDRFYAIVDGRTGQVGRTFAYLRNARREAQTLARMLAKGMGARS